MPRAAGDGREPVLGAILAALEQRNAPVKARRANALLQDLLKHDEGPLEPGFSLPDEAQQRIEARLQDFEAARTGLRTLSRMTSAPHPEDGPPPWIVRRIERTDPGFDSLPRFWDQVGLLYRNHQTDALSPDPYFATGTVPPLASALRGPAPDRKQLPHFEPGPCTGCGACWSVCPDGAIGPIAITPAALIESGMAIARKQGRSADALRRVGSKLASQMSARLRTDAPPESVRNLIAGAYQELVEKGTVPEDARTAMDEAAEALEWGVGGLGVSVTRPFFGDPESKKRGSGEIFSIAIDSDACQGCEACVTACEPKALLARPDSPARSMEARARWRIWEELPDPGGETMTRLRDDREFSSGAALLLSRHARLAMSGGGKAEPGSGAKLAVRYALAAAELERQPRVQRTVAAIDARKEALALQIRETMVQALPADDIEALAQGLEGIGRSADLAELAGRVERAGGKGRVNLSRLTDLVETARRLEDLRWQLQSGVNGLGRARAGLAWDPGLRSHWAVQFPDNPFAGPIVIDGSGESLSIAAGLMAGQLERAIEEATVLRHAVQLTSPDKNPAERPAIYADLLEEEKGLLAPIWLVIESEKLAGRIEPLDRALGQALPLRILAISDQLSDPFDVGLRALVQRDVFVVQSSVSHPDHLLRSLMSALASDGPALAHVLAPSPRAHGWKSDQSVPRAREAVSSLAFPLFRYDPAREGVFGSRIDLDGNTPGVPSTPAPADSGSWRVLQELAGAVTPFTGQVREEVLAEVSAKHAQELAAQKAELEQRIAETEASVRSELNAQLRRRLAELAIRGRELAEARGESR
ncbi:MAG: 4Fe-4S binding protein [Candidatus Eisenbacteria bacterium]